MLLTDVGRRTTVLQVTISLGGNVPRNANTCATVSNARAKCANMGGLVTTAEAQLVVLAIDSDVLVMFLAQLLDGSLDGLNTTLLSHRLC